MSAPPVKKSKGSSSITMVVDGNIGWNQYTTSPVHHISGFPWRVQVFRGPEGYSLSLLCDASDDFELWECNATVKISCRPYRRIKRQGVLSSHPFCSWKQTGFWDEQIGTIAMDTTINNEPTTVTIFITTSTNGESFTRRPSLEERSLAHDMVLVVEGEKFPVNKQVLAAQSTYFNCLFFGGYKETNQKEIEMKDVDPKDFHELLKMIYGDSTEPTTEDNAKKYLMMAEIFDLKMMRDRIENFLLNQFNGRTDRKLLILEQFKLNTLKRELFRVYSDHWEKVCLFYSPVFAELSQEMKNALFPPPYVLPE